MGSQITRKARKPSMTKSRKMRVSIVVCLSELSIAEAVKRDEDGFGANRLFSSDDFSTDLLLAEDEADVETRTCTSFVEICRQDDGTVEDPRNALDRTV